MAINGPHSHQELPKRQAPPPDRLEHAAAQPSTEATMSRRLASLGDRARENTMVVEAAPTTQSITLAFIVHECGDIRCCVDQSGPLPRRQTHMRGTYGIVGLVVTILVIYLLLRLLGIV